MPRRPVAVDGRRRVARDVEVEVHVARLAEQSDRRLQKQTAARLYGVPSCRDGGRELETHRDPHMLDARNAELAAVLRAKSTNRLREKRRARDRQWRVELAALRVVQVDALQKLVGLWVEQLQQY